MDDNGIHARITSLVDEEHALRASSDHTPEDRQRLEALEVQLDQAWDLLRQRDALRAAGKSPTSAETRPASEVEGYLQ
jgi:hypothetical protein